MLLVLAGCAPDRTPDIKSPDPYARALAVLDLVLPLEEGANERLLLQYLDDPHPLVRDSAMIAMSDIGLRRHAGLVALKLADPYEEVRVRACITLGEMKDPATMPALIDAGARDASPRVRRQAAYALADFGNERPVLEAMIQGLADADPSVRFVAHEMLVRLTGKGETPRSAPAWRKALGYEQK